MSTDVTVTMSTTPDDVESAKRAVEYFRAEHGSGREWAKDDLWHLNELVSFVGELLENQGRTTTASRREE